MRAVEERTGDYPVLPPMAQSRSNVAPSSSAASAWRAVAAFGWVLTVVGFVDVALAWYPLGFGDPTWEFGAVNMSYTSLPLLTMGLAGVLAASLAHGKPWVVRSIGAALVVLGLVLFGAYVAFYLLNVPIALKLAPPPVMIGLKKAIVKTSVMGVVFPATYLLAGILSFRHVGTPLRKGKL